MLESLASSLGLVGVLAACLIVMLILYGSAELVKHFGSKKGLDASRELTENYQVTVTGKRAHGRIYFATFQKEDGSREEIELPGEEYGLIAEGDTGSLTKVDGHYVRFERKLN